MESSATTASRHALARLLAGSTDAAKADAARLIARHGSLAAVLDASAEVLIRDIPAAAAERIAAARAAQLCAQSNAIVLRPVMANRDRLDSYLRSRLAHLGREQVRALFLDKAGRLIVDELISEGTVDESAIFPRELVRRALELDASALILTHNHPSQDATPSSADIRVTKHLQRAAACLDIRLIDHIIVGSTNFSMRSAGMLA
ncbi:JAB domain-containing protein [Novosphingopyxis sp.]|uniref:JAB domain-containing protein n=1 Tax=Novosphingopyxis sp. TaxID=2709690 RepID=UPI003B59CB30